MTAINQDFILFSGNSKTLSVTVYGEEVDLIGSTITWILKQTDGTDPVLITKSTTNGGVMISDSTHFDVLLNTNETKGMKGTYYHESNCVDAAGNTSTLLVGSIEIKESHI